MSDGYASHYESSLLALLSKTDQLNIVVVGANDGLVGDPIYDFVRMFPERTHLLLVEPQKELIPYLKENYSFHPDYTVFNGAVGSEKAQALLGGQIGLEICGEIKTEGLAGTSCFYREDFPGQANSQELAGKNYG